MNSNQHKKQFCNFQKGFKNYPLFWVEIQLYKLKVSMGFWFECAVKSIFQLSIKWKPKFQSLRKCINSIEFYINKRNLHKRYQYRNWEGIEFRIENEVALELIRIDLRFNEMFNAKKNRRNRKNMLIFKWIPNWKADSRLHFISSGGFGHSVKL